MVLLSDPDRELQLKTSIKSSGNEGYRRLPQQKHFYTLQDIFPIDPLSAVFCSKRTM
jgi:hypothetical protein